MRFHTVAALLALPALTGCLGSGDFGSTEVEWNVARKTATQNHEFENAGTRAEFNVAWLTSRGQVALRVLDGANATVYQSLLEVSADERQERHTTEAGEPGRWVVRLEFGEYTGRGGIVIEGRR